MTDPNPELRASDADRENVAKALQEHFAQGRLDSDEFQTRMDSVYAAKTMGELVPLTRDLPARDLNRLPERAAQPDQKRAALRHPVYVIPWSVWAGVSTLNFAIWAIVSAAAGGEAVYPWWIWVAGPWGAVMFFVTLTLLLLGVPRRR